MPTKGRMMITEILIADDHPVIRLGLRSAISLDTRFRIAGEASNPDELMHELERQCIDLLLTDFHMPDGHLPDGLSMLASIKRKYPTLPIVLLTMMQSPHTLRHALKAGVRGIVDKTAELTLLPDILTMVSSGSIYISQGLLGGMGPRQSYSSLLATLSEREIEVVRWYASGLPVTAIARKLGRTVSTISHNKFTAMNKLGVASNAALIILAQEHGLITGD